MVFLEDLVRLARAGDADALNALCEQVYPRLYGFFVRLLRSRQSADDLTQEALLRMIASIDRYRALPGSKFESWLFRLAYNLFIDHTRRQKPAEDVDSLPLEDPGGDVEGALLKDERSRAIRQAIARLDPELRAMVVLYYGMERSQSEVAKSLGVSRTRVKWRLMEARKMLKTWLKEDVYDG